MSRQYHQLTVAVGFVEWKGKFLLTRRIDSKHLLCHGKWHLPGGKIGFRETPVEALQREIYEEAGISIYSPCLLGVETKYWEKELETQQTFILLYHCYAEQGDVVLNLQENDAFIWEGIEEILQREDLLEGTILMLQKLYVNRQQEERAEVKIPWRR